MKQCRVRSRKRNELTAARVEAEPERQPATEPFRSYALLILPGAPGNSCLALGGWCKRVSIGVTHLLARGSHDQVDLSL
jgi:hypothetical protein